MGSVIGHYAAMISSTLQDISSNYNNTKYSTLLHFWLVEDLTELADGPTRCGEVAWGGSLFAWKFSVTRSTAFTDVERNRPNMTLMLH
jgi:hypothetical protein